MRTRQPCCVVAELKRKKMGSREALRVTEDYPRAGASLEKLS